MSKKIPNMTVSRNTYHNLLTTTEIKENKPHSVTAIAAYMKDAHGFINA